MTTGYLLDISRSMRRAGRVATGIDRVEMAYIKHFLSQDVRLAGFARTAFGYVLVDAAGLRSFHARLTGDVPWGRASLLSRMAGRRELSLMRAESDLRRLATARCPPGGLARMLRGTFAQPYDYYNVGHSNLTDRVLGAVKASGGRIHVMIQDVIPLELPEFQRPGTVAPFRDRIERVRRLADRVIYVSADTRSRAEAVMRLSGPVPPFVVAHNGVDVPRPDMSLLAPGVMPDQPYFVAVGTIEPRKNHAFLLDLWDRMGAAAPPLLICGGRGWNNAAVFDRLDRLPPGGPVRELPGLPDQAVAALVQNAAGMLFPTFSEGYGLPPVEAAALGTRVVCNDLPVLREVLGDRAFYASLTDPDLWINTIKRWASEPDIMSRQCRVATPTWADHFNVVLSRR